MARGKYAVRAANRLAEIDAGLVVELREKVGVLSAERNALRQQVDHLTREAGAEAQRVGAALAADRVRELEAQLRDEQQRRQSDGATLCQAVFARLNDLNLRLPLTTWRELADLFGEGHRVGQLMAGPDNNRRTRRATTKALRIIDERYNQGLVHWDSEADNA